MRALPLYRGTLSKGTPSVKRRVEGLPGLAPATGVESAPPATEPLIVQRTVRGPQDLRQILQPTLRPTVVQAAPEATTETATEATSTQEAGGEEEKQDIDVLAREVYRIIRRRLTVERERERGRA